MRFLIGVIILFTGIKAISQSRTPEPFDKNDKALFKVYKKYNDNVRLSELYFEHGNVKEGLEYFEKAKAAGKCQDCESFLSEQLWLSQFPIATKRAYSVAVYKIDKDDSVAANIATLKALVHTQQFYKAAYSLGNIYKGSFYKKHNEQSFALNMDSALYYSELAATNNYVPAMFQLAELYTYADGSYNAKPGGKYNSMVNLTKAYYWYKKADSNNYVPAKAMVEAIQTLALAGNADLYALGCAAYKNNNYEEAYKWFKTSDLILQDANAAFMLGIMHFLGKVPNKNSMDFQEAEIWFLRAGNFGNAKGYFWKAKLVWEFDGFGSTAMEYYQKAADMGIKDALAEKQKIQNYTNAVIADRNKPAATSAIAKNIFGDDEDNNASYSTTKRQVSTKKSTFKTSTCSACGGSGTIHSTIYGGAKGPGGTTIFGENRTCGSCNGKGYN